MILNGGAFLCGCDGLPLAAAGKEMMSNVFGA